MGGIRIEVQPFSDPDHPLGKDEENQNCPHPTDFLEDGTNHRIGNRLNHFCSYTKIISPRQIPPNSRDFCTAALFRIKFGLCKTCRLLLQFLNLSFDE